MRLASRFGRYNSIRRERLLTDDELMQFNPPANARYFCRSKTRLIKT